MGDGTASDSSVVIGSVFESAGIALGSQLHVGCVSSCMVAVMHRNEATIQTLVRGKSDWSLYCS